MTRHRWMVALAVAFGLVAGACGGDDSADWTPEVGAEFVTGCTGSGGGSPDAVKICQCSFAGIVQTGISYDRFVEVNEAGEADPELPLPLDFRVPLNECLENPDAYDPNDTVYPGADE